MSELHDAAKAFYNITIADATVIVRAGSMAKRDAIAAAGERLRAAILAAPAVQSFNELASQALLSIRMSIKFKSLTDEQRRLINTALDTPVRAPAPAGQDKEDAERWRVLECMPRSKVRSILERPELAERYKPSGPYTLKDEIDAIRASRTVAGFPVVVNDRMPANSIAAVSPSGDVLAVAHLPADDTEGGEV